MELIDYLMSKRVNTFISVQNSPQEIKEFKQTYSNNIEKLVIGYDDIDLTNKMINID